MCTPHNNDEKWADMFRDTVFVDDVNGGDELDKNLVIEARKTEMEFFKKMAVYCKDPKSEIKRQGGKIISTRWIDTDKGNRGNPNCRSRLVAREIKKDKRQDLFSATLPLETLKLLVADCAKGQRQAKPLRIGIFDESRAYFHAPVTRPLFINIPVEDWEEGDEGFVGQLQIILYGTRDAAQNWAATNIKFLVKIGFQRGRASSCNFVHKKRNIKMTVHGDDFLVVADLDQIKWIEEQLKGGSCSRNAHPPVHTTSRVPFSVTVCCLFESSSSFRHRLTCCRSVSPFSSPNFSPNSFAAVLAQTSSSFL